VLGRTLTNNWQTRAANANLPYTALSGYGPDPAYKRHKTGSVMLFVDDHMAVLTQDELMDRNLVHYSNDWW